MGALGILGGRPRGQRLGVLGGAMGLGVFPSPSKYPNGYPTSTYLTKSGETGSTIARDITGDANKWTELANANPSTKCTQYGMCFSGGKTLTLPASWVAAGSPTTPTSTTAATALPFPVGVSNATALKWQYMLNTELAARGLQTVPEDGVFNTATCNGLAAFVRSYQQAPNDPTPDDTFLSLVSQYHQAIYDTCTALSKPATTTAPAPAPTTTAVSATDLMKQQQTMLNTWLVSVGFNPIQVTGKWDGPTCGAGQLMAKTLPDSDPTKVALAAVLTKIKPLLGMPCGVTVQPVAPTRTVSPVQTPVPITSTTTSAPKVDPCTINFGTKNAVVTEMQGYLNKLLDKNGYLPIPVTGVWDAASCGAVYTLSGQFDPYIAACKGGYWTVPASCPQKVLPKKKAVKTVPKPPPPVQQASMAKWGILAAVLGAGALLVAKKKGLIGGAKLVAKRRVA